MKKYVICILAISILVLGGCKGDEISKPDATPQVSTGDLTTDLQNTKTIIDVNAQNAKMTFTTSDLNISKVEKEIAIDKLGAIEEYAKSDVEKRSFDVFGVKYENIDYYRSEKNKYTEKDVDIFENDSIKIEVSPTGEVMFFRTRNATKVFEDETTHSEELAKKYLELIYPNYGYDEIQYYGVEVTDQYIYQFFKTVNGIRSADSITIFLNSNGGITCYHLNSIGKFDNIEIKNFNYNDFLQRIDKYVNEAYKDKFIDYTIGEDGPSFNLFAENKLELTIPIAINISDSNNIEYSITEEVVFELN